MNTLTMDQIEAPSNSSFWIVTLLVSGTCIGGGMLALPVQTATAGFSFSMIGIMICWLFMTYTGLLLVEATLWIKNESHFSSLSRILIGNKARFIALIVYLFMNYTSLVAYTAGGAALVGNQLKQNFGITLSYEINCVLFTLLFGSIIYLGSTLVGKLNFIFMIGLGLTYLGLVGIGFNQVEMTRLAFQPPWKENLGIFSIILATFSYQMIVPSLCLQLNYDADRLKKAIILGTTIPFAVYSIWLFIVHGVVPLEGENGLLDALQRGASATESLRFQFKHWSLVALSDFFGFFAVTTSYLGLSLALFYFLKDCFQELKINISRKAIILTSILPTLFFSMLFPQALVRCLDMSGGYGDTILSGLIPISMVWVGRYHKKISGTFTVPGGKIALVLAAAFYFYIFLLQIF